MSDLEVVFANLLALYIIVLQVRVIRLSKRVENLELDNKVGNYLKRMRMGEK